MNNVIELKFTPITKDLHEVEFKGGIEGKDPDLIFTQKNVPSFDCSKYHDYQEARAKLYKYELRRGGDEVEIEIDRDAKLDCQTLAENVRIKIKKISVENKHDGERSLQTFKESAETLLTTLNDWGNLPEFTRIRKAIADRSENLRVTISSECPDLRKQPFHQWNLFPDGVEVVFSSIEAARLPRFYREKIRILIILGDSSGIDIEKDKKAIEQYCKNDAILEILAQPTRAQLETALADPDGWDIIFFSGHSHTENTDIGRICINANDSLTMAELQDVLKPAIEQRVQIAIFNSCDGLGLAPVLEELNIDRIIVMREPIPDKIAQEFLKSFLAAFTQGKRFDDAVKFARQELVHLERNYPYVSWLPIIIQNRLAPSITWQSLGKVKSPYKGLFAFTEADVDNFYGREDTTDRLYQLVWNQPLIAIIGASGSGKSSVVQAGLIPALKKHFERDWQIITMRPGRKPFDALARAILNCEHRGLAGSDLQRIELDVDLASDRTLLTQKLAQIRCTENRVLLFIDQFEEVFTQSEDEAERQVFLQSLADAVNNAPKFTLVFTLRNDFLPTIQSDRQDSDFRQLLERYSPQLLGSMTRDRLTAAITKPAAKLGVQFESGLVDRLLRDVGTTNGSLAILQWVLDLLWAKQQPRLLTHEQYEKICGQDGINTALADRAEEIYAGFVFDNRVKQFKQVFCRLVTPGARTTATTRRIATREEIGEDNWREIVVPLATERLLTTDRDAETGVETVEIIHEKIIDNWQRLQNWVADYREELERIAEIEAAAKKWLASNKSEKELWGRIKLKEAQEFMRDRNVFLPTITIVDDFLSASNKNKKSMNRGVIWKQVMVILILFNLWSLRSFLISSSEKELDKEGNNCTYQMSVAIDILKFFGYEFRNINYGYGLNSKNLSCANLQGANLQGANLRAVTFSANTNFQGADLRGADFSHSNLTGANLKNADLSDADLSGANLERANLTEAGLTSADLTVANLTGANLTGIKFQLTNLEYANLTGANLTGTSTRLKDAKLKGANLTGANLTGFDLEYTNLENTNLTGVILQGANLRGANLKSMLKGFGANLKGINLKGANLEGADLSWANLTGANLDGANLTDANLEFANLQFANLAGFNLQRANLKDANLTGANLERANLERATLRLSKLQKANFKDANLKDANFRGADLEHTNLQGANIDSAIFGTSIYSDNGVLIARTATKITPEQIKLAKNWEKAEYDPEFRKKLESKNETGSVDRPVPVVPPVGAIPPELGR